MLDVKNIFLVICTKDYSEDEVRQILIEDGYDDNFVFGSRYEKGSEEWKPVMEQCDEVWVFGQTHRTFGVSKWQHSYALKKGMEVWKMA